jgi:rfaE bifunctional protein nucleotidyltransferase chain/domain
VGEILSFEEILPRVAELKARGKRIAFANGHFDVLHVGHLRYLRAAKQEGDVLVVAINDDESVARLKGLGRPIAPEQERAELVAGLEPVDLVVIFSGDSPGPLMERLQPDVHCKGPDYGTPDKVPEYDVVRRYGGDTRLVGDPKDHSTTDLIQKIRRMPD